MQAKVNLLMLHLTINLFKMKKVVFALLASLTIFASCSKDDDTIAMTTISVSVSTPADYPNIKQEGIEVKFKNVSTNTVYSAFISKDGRAELPVESGTYTISAESKQSVTTSIGTEIEKKEFTQEVTFRGLQENLTLVGATHNLKLSLTPSFASNGFIIKEIYFSGCQTPLKKAYMKDHYIELYNNSDKVLYADGLSICEMAHNTGFEVDEWAKVVSDGVAVHTIYTIPGNGSTYKIAPGQSIVIANIAINHKVEAPNSVDLSKANWEWYDEHKLDVDVPEVPNLIKNFSYSLSVWGLHARGMSGLLIFQETNMAKFLTENKVSKQNASGSNTMNAYRVPTDRIIDAVELAYPSMFGVKALPASIDASYTYATKALEGKCVSRKVDKKVGDRVIYRDTNNSALDFSVDQNPAPGQNK